MDVITTESETAFAEFLTILAPAPDSWVCIHVNMAVISEETLNNEGLSRQSLEKIHCVSGQIAQKLCDLGLQPLEGKTFLFDDGDVAALFLCAHPYSSEITETLRHEFIAQDLGRLFHSYDMKEKMAALITLSKEKIISAADYQSKRRAVDKVDGIFDVKEPDVALTGMIQKKRNTRTGGVILVIEDDLLMRGLMASALQKEYKVVQAKDAKSGIAAYIDHAPNVVLLDIHLPDHTGHEVLNRLKLLDPQAYVVIVSADSVSDNVLLTNASGGAGFIKKPFSKEKLLGSIKKCPTLGGDALAKKLGWK